MHFKVLACKVFHRGLMGAKVKSEKIAVKVNVSLSCKFDYLHCQPSRMEKRIIDL